MWKYIVTYLIIKTVYIPCPQPEPKPDEYGRTSRVKYQTSGLCYRADTIEMKKEFSERKDAVDFIKRGESEKQFSTNQFSSVGYLANFKLDSVKIKYSFKIKRHDNRK